MGEGLIDGTQIAILLLAVVGLTVVMLSTRRRIRASQDRSNPRARERYAELQGPRQATRDLETVMLELDQLSRQIHGRIDTKLARLETVIRDADQRIERLARLCQAPDHGAALEITLDKEDPAAPAERAVGAEDDPHTAVYRLADRGLSAAQIVQEVGRLQGEVELILALRRTREADGASPDLVAPTQRAGHGSSHQHDH